MDSWLHIAVASQYSFQQNTNSFCVPQSPPCSEPACLFKSHHSSPWPRATARSTLSPLLGSFLSFLWALSPAVPSVWNTVPADLHGASFSHYSGLSSNVTSSEKPLRNPGQQKERSFLSHYIHIAQFVFIDPVTYVFLCLLFILFITIYSFIVSVSETLHVMLKLVPQPLRVSGPSSISIFGMNAWLLGSQKVSLCLEGCKKSWWGKGEGDLAFLLLTTITAVTAYQLLILGLLLDLLVSGQAQLDSPLPPSARRARFRCATLCSKLLITTNGNRSSPRVNWRLTKQPQAWQLLVSAEECVPRDSWRI